MLVRAFLAVATLALAGCGTAAQSEPQTPQSWAYYAPPPTVVYVPRDRPPIVVAAAPSYAPRRAYAPLPPSAWDAERAERRARVRTPPPVAAPAPAPTVVVVVVQPAPAARHPRAVRAAPPPAVRRGPPRHPKHRKHVRRRDYVASVTGDTDRDRKRRD